jgi:predicted trehalose synthase
MTDQTESLMLEHLKRFQATLDRVERKQEETVSRIGHLEVSLAGLRRDIAHGDEIDASGAVRMDRLSERLDRIERRLELA